MNSAKQSNPAANLVKAPATPLRLQCMEKFNNVNDALESLGRQAGLKFPPRHEMQSPSKRTHSPAYDAKHAFSQLFWLNRSLLEETIRDFLGQIHTVVGEDERMALLQSRLNAAEQTHLRTCKSTRAAKVQISQMSASVPPSPTFSIKHGLVQGPQDASERATLPTLGAHTDDVSRNTSFANISFWSKLSGTSQKDHSPATSIASFQSMQECPEDAIGMITSNDARLIDREALAPSAKRDMRNPGGSDDSPPDKISSKKRPCDVSPLPERSREPLPTKQTNLPNRSVQTRFDQAYTPSAQQYPASSRFQGGMIHRDAPFFGADTTQIDPHDNLSSPIKQADSSSRMKHPPESLRVRKIAEDGLTTKRLPTSFDKLPLCLRLEAYRLIQTGSVSADGLDQMWSGSKRTLSSLYQLASSICPSFKRGFTSEGESFEMCAKMRWSRSSSREQPVFKLDVMMPTKGRSNSFQRKFGRQRFLQVDLPCLRHVPPGMALQGQSCHIADRVHELLDREQVFLGCKWRLLLVQPKKGKSQHDEDFRKAGAVQLLFFAVSSNCAIDAMLRTSIADVVNWALPLRENKDQPACKAYARLDLAASRTDAVYLLKPHDISYDEADKGPTGDFDETMFNDPTLDFTEPDNGNDVLSDGQSWISPWLMREIQNILKLEYLPSAVQGRLFGCKGIWHLASGDPPTGKPDGCLIGISNSQIKAWQKRSNFAEDRYDPHSLTFNVVKVSGPATASVVYADFLPILEDRGVSCDRLRRFFDRVARKEVDEFLTALQTRVALQKWIHSRTRLGEEAISPSSVHSTFPQALAQQVKCLLQAGFEPTRYEHLSKEVRRLGERTFEEMRRQLKIGIPRSTMVFGIADPYSCLGPGEIHLGFSRPFQDSETQEYCLQLEACTALVARNPVLWASDIQKVRVVFRPELAHLKDVVVFPSTGKRSLASKLSGGDYDGDIFWVCWQPELVEGFLNAPAPWKLPDPETEFGVSIDRSKLGTKLGLDKDPFGPIDEVKVVQWLAEQGKKRMRGGMLGPATLAYGKAVYHGGSFRTPQAFALAALHDHLVDADKQGFEFDNEAWEAFKNRYSIPILPKPAYRKYLADGESYPSDETGAYSAPNENNILDHMCFVVVEGVFQSCLRESDKILRGTQSSDPDLNALYESLSSESANGSFISKEMKSLKIKLAKMMIPWTRVASRSVRLKQVAQTDIRNGRTPQMRSYNDIDEGLNTARKSFVDIFPDDSSHPTAIEWLRRTGGNSPTTWELIRTSALAKLHHKNAFLIWNIAGDDLCRLKARACKRTREIDLELYVELKPIARKRRIAEVRMEDGENDDDEFDDGESIFDSFDITDFARKGSR